MSDEFAVELNFGPPPPRCKHCGREKGNHKAGSFHCPIGRGSFPTFSTETVYTPRKTRAKQSTPGQ